MRAEVSTGRTPRTGKGNRHFPQHAGEPAEPPSLPFPCLPEVILSVGKKPTLKANTTGNCPALSQQTPDTQNYSEYQGIGNGYTRAKTRFISRLSIGIEGKSYRTGSAVYSGNRSPIVNINLITVKAG